MQIPIVNANRFYVYEHVRNDTGAIFYVGKGQANRAFVSSKHHRSDFWRRVVDKAGGFSVRFVAEGMDEEMAFLIEQERINQLRKLGAELCNLTDGGDGTSGWIKTPEWRAKVGAAHRGKTLSPETRSKISKSVIARGYVHPDDVMKRIADFNRGHRYNVGRIQPEDERKKRSASLIGNRSRTGQKRSEQERAKASASLSGRKQTVIVCPHCQSRGGNSMRRWHFDNCKDRT